MDSLVCAVALRSIDGIGDILFKRLIESFGSAEKALAASPEKLQEVEGIGAKPARAIASMRDFEPARKVIEKAEASPNTCMQQTVGHRHFSCRDLLGGYWPPAADAQRAESP
jgi:NAD-dependent DNA ligase